MDKFSAKKSQGRTKDHEKLTSSRATRLFPHKFVLSALIHLVNLGSSREGSHLHFPRLPTCATARPLVRSLQIIKIPRRRRATHGLGFSIASAGFDPEISLQMFAPSALATSLLSCSAAFRPIDGGMIPLLLPAPDSILVASRSSNAADRAIFASTDARSSSWSRV